MIVENQNVSNAFAIVCTPLAVCPENAQLILICGSVHDLACL